MSARERKRTDGNTLAEHFNHNLVGKFYVTRWHFLLGDSDLDRKKIFLSNKCSFETLFNLAFLISTLTYDSCVQRIIRFKFEIPRLLFLTESILRDIYQFPQET